MAEFTIKPGTITKAAVNFTPSVNITIDSIKNTYALGLNFNVGDNISSGTELKFSIVYDSVKVQPEAIVTYTEL